MKTTTYLPLVSQRLLWEAGVIVAVALAMSVPSLARAETLYRQLEVGSSGSDVSALQTFLALDSTIYPQGLVTGYFGFLTKAAVANFQARNEIPPVGRVGPITLPVLNFQMSNKTTGNVDVYAPVIASIQINTYNTSATVNWTTNEASRGKLYYGTSPIQMRNSFEQTGVAFAEPSFSGTLASYDGGVRTSQTVSINGLTPNTFYYYLIAVFDASGNMSISLPAYFHTAQ